MMLEVVMEVVVDVKMIKEVKFAKEVKIVREVIVFVEMSNSDCCNAVVLPYTQKTKNLLLAPSFSSWYGLAGPKNSQCYPK